MARPTTASTSAAAFTFMNSMAINTPWKNKGGAARFCS
jgi:hypothetical protein